MHVLLHASIYSSIHPSTFPLYNFFILDVHTTPTETNSEASNSRDTSPGMELEAQEYVAIDSYEASGPGQINFNEGEVITVLDKIEDGENLLL